jgi:hypothetical protein
VCVAGDPGASVAAVLVEGRQYMYCYGTVGQEVVHGDQQIIDLDLPDGESVMGGRLVPGPVAGGSQLMVLTQQRLLVYDLAV